MAEIDGVWKLCSLPLSCRSPPLRSLSHLHALDTLPRDVVNIISEHSNLICCKGKTRSELVDLRRGPNTFFSRVQSNESNFLVIRNDFNIPSVSIFDTDGKVRCRFDVTVRKRERLHLHTFALIGNDIYLSIEKSKSDESDAFDFIVVYDSQGNFKNQWPTKFSTINSMISCGEHILLTTEKELYIQVFNRYGDFSHKFGDYELWGQTNPHVRCSLSRWAHGCVMASYRGKHHVYYNEKLIQVLTFEDFGLGTVDNFEFTTHILYCEILFFVHIHPTQYEVFVFKHVSSKVELKRTFTIEITAEERAISSVFSYPNGSICILFKDGKIHIYK